jgi:hypothetical protein
LAPFSRTNASRLRDMVAIRLELGSAWRNVRRTLGLR